MILYGNNYCECWCGRECTKIGNRYIQGHHNKVRTEETLIKMVNIKKGKPSPKKGKILTEDQKATRKQKMIENGTNISPMKGKHQTEEAKLKVSKFRKGLLFTIEHKQKLSDSAKGRIPWNIGLVGVIEAWNKNMKMSEEFCRKNSEAQKALHRTGEKSPNWKGGITPINHKIRNSDEYKEWRNQIFERDQFICHRCNGKGYLHAHHIINFSKLHKKNQFLYDINNGITFCRDCHGQFHLKYGNKNNNQQQIFEFVYLNNVN